MSNRISVDIFTARVYHYVAASMSILVSFGSKPGIGSRLMIQHTLRHFAAFLLPVLVTITPICDSVEANEEIDSKILGVAIDGYDPVAYFRVGQALKGSENFTFYWNDAEWRFINAEHRDLFAANPNSYAPRHGGF